MDQRAGCRSGLQVEFVAVPRSTSEDVLTTMMTGGNAPDIIFSYDQNVFLNYANLVVWLI